MAKQLLIKSLEFTGNTTLGSAIITNIPSTTGMVVGDFVAGTGIPTGSYILTVDSAIQITLDTNATATNTAQELTVMIEEVIVKHAEFLGGFPASQTAAPNTVVARDTSGDIKASTKYYYGATAYTEYNATDKTIDFVFID